MGIRQPDQPKDSTVTHAGGIVFRKVGRQVQYLLVRAKSPPTAWVFPKGHIEKGETAEAAAEREVMEEGGIRAKVVQLLGLIPSGTGASTAMFLMSVENGARPRTAEREKLWLNLSASLDKLSFDESKSLLRVAAKKMR